MSARPTSLTCHATILSARVTGMTPEELDAQKARQRNYERKWRATRTSSQLDARRKNQREYYRRRRAIMTPEQRDVQKAYQREYYRKWRANRKSDAGCQREYNRK